MPDYPEDVNWLTDRHYFLLAVIVYGLSAVYSLFLWRKGFRLHDRANYLLLLIGFGLQMKAMMMRQCSRYKIGLYLISTCTDP